MSAGTMTTDIEVGGDVTKTEMLATAERSVLAASMLSTVAYERAAAVINGTSFADPRHERIWDAITAIVAQGTASARVKPDVTLVAAHLLEQGTLGTVGGHAYLLRIVDELPTVENADWYAKIVANGARDRSMVELGLRLQQAGDAALSSAERDGVLSDALGTIEAVAGGGAAESPVQSIDAAADELIAALEGIGPKGVTTGLTELDAILGGLVGGQVVVVGARPGTGKTVVAQALGAHVAGVLHRPVLAFCLEMRRAEMLKRLYSAEGRINSRRLNLAAPDMDEDAWRRFMGATETIRSMPFYTCDERTITPNRLNALIGGFKRQHPDLAIVTIDYAQLITGDGRFANRQEEVASVSRAIKLMAMRHDVPILLLSQLNRGPEQRSDKKPQMADLRESGAYEQDADAVILLHRDDQYQPECERAGEMDLIVAKNRNGGTGTAVVASQMHYYRLCDLGADAR